MLLALQSVLGVFRFAAPMAIGRLGGVKSSTIVLLAGGYGLLCLLPVLGLPGFPPPARLPFFVVLIGVHQLLESLGTVTLWAWLAEIVPPRLRGRYFARRQRWQLGVLIPTLLAAGWFADWFRTRVQHFSTDETTIAGYSVPVELVAIAGYTLLIGLGALLLAASVVPLVRMPAVAARLAAPSSRPLPRATGSLAPLFDSRFRRLLLFGCWISFFNGLPQSAAQIYHRRVLDLGLLPMLLLPVGMRLGQMALSGWAGRLSDRYGNRPVLLACQGCVAFGPLFYLLASPAEPWWLAGAYAVWSAYVGLNICLPNLTLKLSRDGNYAAYSAAYFALSGLAYGVSTYLGGWLFDYFHFDHFYVGGYRLDHYGYLFYIGWITRLLALVLLLAIDEPGAWTWRRILAARQRRAYPPTSVQPG